MVLFRVPAGASQTAFCERGNIVVIMANGTRRAKSAGPNCCRKAILYCLGCPWEPKQRKKPACQSYRPVGTIAVSFGCHLPVQPFGPAPINLHSSSAFLTTATVINSKQTRNLKNQPRAPKFAFLQRLFHRCHVSKLFICVRKNRGCSFQDVVASPVIPAHGGHQIGRQRTCMAGQSPIVVPSSAQNAPG